MESLTPKSAMKTRRPTLRSTKKNGQLLRTRRQIIAMVVALMVGTTVYQHVTLLSEDSFSEEKQCSESTSMVLGNADDCDAQHRSHHPMTNQLTSTNSNKRDSTDDTSKRPDPIEAFESIRENGEDSGAINNKYNDIVNSGRQSGISLGPIFYNFFVPFNGTENALRIAKEQMSERAMSAEPNSTLLYTLIGNPNITSQDFGCFSECHQREYRKVGDEIDTYQALWEYCQRHPHEIITYTHDRGSFHYTKMNEKSRRFATKAAFECRMILLQMQQDHDDRRTNHTKNEKPVCNICSARFNFVPQFHSSGNMWTATCSYIQHLVPPENYSSTMQTMYDATLLHPIHSQIGNKYGCLRPRNTDENHLGINRYAAERWIYSHPYLEPCDILPMDVGVAPITFPQEWIPKVQKHIKYNFVTTRKFALKKQTRSSFSHLVGRLFEYKYLYNLTPPNTSWIWDAHKHIEIGTRKWLQHCMQLNDDISVTYYKDEEIGNDEVISDLLKLFPPPKSKSSFSNNKNPENDKSVTMSTPMTFPSMVNELMERTAKKSKKTKAENPKKSLRR